MVVLDNGALWTKKGGTPWGKNLPNRYPLVAPGNGFATLHLAHRVKYRHNQVYISSWLFTKNVPNLSNHTPMMETTDVIKPFLFL